MENILDRGVEVVLWLQQLSPALDLPFKSLTFLGNLEFFLIFMPLIYWCNNRRTGARLLVVFLISAYVNAIAKVMAGHDDYEIEVHGDTYPAKRLTRAAWDPERKRLLS